MIGRYEIRLSVSRKWQHFVHFDSSAKRKKCLLLKISSSVQCGQIWWNFTPREICKILWQILEDLFSIWQNIEHKLVNLNEIKNIFIVVNWEITSPSGHTAVLTLWIFNEFFNFCWRRFAIERTNERRRCTKVEISWFWIIN